MSRSTGLPSVLGKATADIKAKFPEVVKEDFVRMSRELGFDSESDFLRDIVMHRLYGVEGMRSMFEDRLRKVAGIGHELGQKA